MPSSMPSSGPSGQPTGQPTASPTIIPLYQPPTGQPTSKPSDHRSNPLFRSDVRDDSINGMRTETAIIIFSCIGGIVLCLFIIFSCYFQDRYNNRKEQDKLHQLVEHHYNEDEVILDDGEGTHTSYYWLRLYLDLYLSLCCEPAPWVPYPAVNAQWL